MCSGCYSAYLMRNIARNRQNQTAWAGIVFGIALGVVLLSLFSKPHSVLDQAASPGSLISDMPDIKVGSQIGESPKDVFKTKIRLIELGFLKGPANDITWDSKSKSALRRFKATAGLEADDIWDERVSGLLFSTKAVHAPVPLAEGSKLR
jgi:hypothetical protein